MPMLGGLCLARKLLIVYVTYGFSGKSMLAWYGNTIFDAAPRLSLLPQQSIVFTLHLTPWLFDSNRRKDTGILRATSNLNLFRNLSI